MPTAIQQACTFSFLAKLRIVWGRFFLFLLVFLSGISTRSWAAAPIGSDLYVQIKSYNITKSDLDRIADSGFAGVRLSVLWYRTERKKGIYSYDLSEKGKQTWDPDSGQAISDERLIDELIKRKLKVMVLLHGGNPLYTGAWQSIYFPEVKEARRVLKAPETKEEMEGFSRFAAHTVSYFNNKYGADKFIWSIWNEPDLSVFFPPSANPEKFSDLFWKTCISIRRVAPDAMISGPGFSQEKGVRPNYSYIAAMLERNNVLDCVDYFTFHPYRPGDPESVTDQYRETRSFLTKYHQRRNVPIAVDEWGYSAIKGDEKRTENMQANRLVRAYLLNQLDGIPFTSIYEWRNRGEDASSRTDNYGLIDFAGEAKPAYLEFAFLLGQLKGYTLEKRIYPKDCGADDYVLVYRKQGSVKAAIWRANNDERQFAAFNNEGVKSYYPLSQKINIIGLPESNDETTYSCVGLR